MQDFTLISKSCDPKKLQRSSALVKKHLQTNYEYVSISHKENRIVGMGSSVPCGIDIEKKADKHPAFTNFVLNTSELEVISNPVVAWSIKESCLKVFNDGYEASDFVISDKHSGVYVVSSKKYLYSVKVIQEMEFVVTVAFVSNSETTYS